MATIRPSRRIERAGVNAVRSLFDEHDLLLQEIDGGVDHGEDMVVRISRNGKPSGHWFAVQVKSGQKYRRARGYAIPVDDHFGDWRNSRIPIIGIVFDPDSGQLFWINITRHLQQSATPTSWIQLPRDSVLSAETIRGFVADTEHYIDSTGLRHASLDAVVRQSVEDRALQQRQVAYGQNADNAPNPMFAGMASLLMRLPWLRRHAKRVWLISALAAIMIADWPYMNRFVTRYDPKYGSGQWVTNIYMFIGFLLLVFMTELRAGRFAQRTLRWLEFFAISFLCLPLLIGDGKHDHWWGQAWIGFGAIAPNVGELVIIGFFVGMELDRRQPEGHP